MIQHCESLGHHKGFLKPLKILGFLLSLGWLLLLPRISGDWEICNPGVSKDVFQFKVPDCPFGVLFEQPIIANCMNSTSGPENYFTDLCDEENYGFDMENKPYKIQLAFGNDNETIDPDSSCAGDAPGKCNVTTFLPATSTTLTEPDRADPCDIDTPDASLTPEEEGRRRDIVVFNQTERMFKFIVNLIKDHDPDGPKFRLVKLLKQSFKLLQTYCDINYVPHKFTDDVLNAFLFLLRDSDLSNFKDVSVEDYEIVMATLHECERMPRDPFELNGKKCKTCSTVHNIEKNGQSMRYQENDFSFEWGRYDLPVDATWGALSFVHGLCYGTFRLDVNYHHLFQRVTETLFTREILHRWMRPPLLYFEDIWDNMFSAPVKSTMRNLDVCIYAAYLQTPFLHRLERPLRGLRGQGGGGGGVMTTTPDPLAGGRRRRRRRSLPPTTLDAVGLTGAGWCFQSKEDLLATTTAYVDLHCPDKRKPLAELEEIFKTRNYIDLDNDNKTDGGTSRHDGGEKEPEIYTTTPDY